ncbi:MAG: DUF4921 family protein [Candidatus Moraniibacteriota bacterium]|nr:MAG: DUF4921 family protein [Candidatus Moranbacteria bacterium]
MEQKKELSQLRQDIVTRDWVVIATGRSKRPEDFIVRKDFVLDESLGSCPFENPEASGQKDDVLIYKKDDGDWTLRVFPNLYPAIQNIEKEIVSFEEGPYFGMSGVGNHELVVPRKHDDHFAKMGVNTIVEMIDAYQDRYLNIMNQKDVRYISIIHNHGKSAGASVYHPHSQIFAVPVVSPYVELELYGSDQHWKSTNRCVFCTVIEYEQFEKTRVVFENEHCIVIAPYASRSAFEMWILPKFHSPYFERITNAQKISLAWAFKRSLGALEKALGNPDYNLYLHTSPCDGKDYPHYHWHFEILPKTSTWAGFELSTGIEISTIEPEVAAKHLRDFV